MPILSIIYSINIKTHLGFVVNYIVEIYFLEQFRIRLQLSIKLVKNVKHFAADNKDNVSISGNHGECNANRRSILM